MGSDYRKRDVEEPEELLELDEPPEELLELELDEPVDELELDEELLERELDELLDELLEDPLEPDEELDELLELELGLDELLELELGLDELLELDDELWSGDVAVVQDSSGLIPTPTTPPVSRRKNSLRSSREPRRDFSRFGFLWFSLIRLHS